MQDTASFDPPNILDALIVGAGPTGLSMAGDLLRHGMNVRIIDRAHQATDLSKAVVLMPRTLEEFAARGLAEEVIKLGEKSISLSTYAHGHMIFHTVYDHLATDYSFLLNIPQADTETILHQYVASNGGRVEWDSELISFAEDSGGVSARIRLPDGSTEQVQAHYLLGCDGAHSTVRHVLNYEFHGAAYHDSWLLADVEIDWRLPHGHIYLFFVEDGLLAVFPMPMGRYRLYVVQPMEEKLGRDPTLEEFQQIVCRFVADGCTLSNSHWLAEFNCHHRKVKHYSLGRVHLAGDAAHIHSPETGLGMNTGIQDAFNLAWKIAWVRKGWADPHLLDSYDSERSFVGKQVLALSDFTHKVWAQFGKLAEVIREPMWRFFSHYYCHHTEKLEEAVQIRIQYPHNPFVVSIGQPEASHQAIRPVEAGMRLVNGTIQPALGSIRDRTDLFALLDARTFILAVFTGAHPAEETFAKVETLVRETESFDDALKSIIIFGGQQAGNYTTLTPNVFIDPTLNLHFLYAAQRGATFLVRPDLYVGYSDHDLNVHPLRNYLRKIFFGRAD